MAAWLEPDRHEHDDVWDRFSAAFRFRPSVDSAEWPGIREPVPSATYSISSAFSENREILERDLNEKTLAALRRCTPAGRKIWALDWQHAGYLFDPHEMRGDGGEAKWKVPILPDGDYYIFLERDLQWGLFGHPWEKTICVFGQPLLEALAESSPRLFEKIVRRDGAPA